MTSFEKELCNRALARIDSTQIEDEDTSSKQYELCDQFLATAIQEALSRTEWAEACGVYDFIVYVSTYTEYSYVGTVPTNVHDVMSTASTVNCGYGRYKRFKSNILFKNHTPITPLDFISGSFYFKGMTFYCETQKLTISGVSGEFEEGDEITSAAGSGTIIDITGSVYTVRHTAEFAAGDTIAKGVNSATVDSVEENSTLYRATTDGLITTATVDAKAEVALLDDSGKESLIITAVVLYNDTTLSEMSDDLQKLCELTLAKILSIPLTQNRGTYGDLLVEIENVVLPEMKTYALNRETWQRQYKHDYIINSRFQR
jgi:hypothetical protein